MKIKFFIIHMLLLMLSACEQAVQVRISLPDSEAEPVIICLASATQPTIAYIGKTIPLDAKMPDPSSLHVLSVEILSEDRQVIGVLLPSGDNGMFSSGQPLDFEEHKSYFVSVQTVEFGVTESALSQLPAAVEIDSMRPAEVMNSFGYYQLNCYFTDRTAGQDFYSTGGQFYSNGTEVRENATYHYLPPFVIADSGFDLSAGELLVEIPKMARAGGTGERLPVDKSNIILYHFSADLGNFISSTTQNEGTYYDVLIEPVPVVSNIKNGHGIFGFFQSDTIPYIP